MKFLNKYKIYNYVLKIESPYPYPVFMNIYLDDNNSIRKASLYLEDAFKWGFIIENIQVYYREYLGEKRFFYKLLAEKDDLKVKNSKDLENILDELLVNASLKNI